MTLIDSFFDLISGAGGVVLGTAITWMLGRNKKRQLNNQIILGRQEIDKIKIENENLLSTIKEKENLILELQLQILGKHKNQKIKKSKK